MDLAAFILSLIAIIISLIQYFSDTSRQQKEATLNAYNELQDTVFTPIKKYCLAEVPQKGSDEWDIFTTFLTKLERFSTGVNTKIYSLSIVNRIGGSYLISLFEKLKPIIDKKRENSNSNGKHYDEFEKMIKALKKKRR